MLQIYKQKTKRAILWAKNEKFNNYKAFVEKFEPKRTTDDCYTPPVVYDAVLKYILETTLFHMGHVSCDHYSPYGDYERSETLYYTTVISTYNQVTYEFSVKLSLNLFVNSECSKDTDPILYSKNLGTAEPL